ncbi:hypothetical protein CesoFtcFv8_027188 [Champsocephalus esox]|uniref:receptor protein-tyrosine kinase n=1 Tax=Champsocephalus esox TaxID=159716 RepID=A0AAN8B0K7_9TELE|nr:hypothetical protein CesoFtcFv8_027188 [Champsocephalus esox]
MAVSNTTLFTPRCVWPTLLILWILLWEASCETQYQAEEAEIFHSDKQKSLGWKSEPNAAWNSVNLASVPVLQACARRMTRTVLSPWMERKDAHYILMDISLAQEEQPSEQLSPLQVHLFDKNTPMTRFQNSLTVLNLNTSRPFPVNEVLPSGYFERRLALGLGPVRRTGFQLAFSYSGTCVLLTSIRLYYRRCPDIVSNLALFEGTGAASGDLRGSCVNGAVEVSPPVRECEADGEWGPEHGGCTCNPGHQVMDDTCQTCDMGYYKPANESGVCRPCPQNSNTYGKGSERCVCLQGYTRLPTDPEDLGCTKPPSAPVNLTARHHNDSVLMVTWDPPHDRGGRQELMYGIKCEKEVESSRQWQACGDTVVFLPDSAGLTNTSVTVSELSPQHGYRLSVQAWNDVSTLGGAPPSSTATVTIHRWKVPPVVSTQTPGLHFSELPVVPTASKSQSRTSMWMTIGILFAILLLMALIPIAVCVLRRNYTKLRSDQDVELLPMNAGVSYRLQQEEEAEPQPASISVVGVVQMLEALGGSMLDSLKEVLVERETLTLGKELGKGEYGSVYEGVFSPAEGGDTKVAVKTMRVGIHSQEDLYEFLREAEIMKTFDHENVVRLLGVTLQREQDSPLPVPLVILPYMKHGDMRRFLIATRYGDIPMFVPHQSLLRFMVDIAGGMQYLSSQGFLHRDLAARNCMLGDDLRVCVADFGLSKKMYSNNYYRQKVAIRVPIKWMAMESLSESLYTTKSDVWSFGVTMWEIVSRGRTPYPGVSNHELLELLLSGHRLKPPQDCDHKLYEVMQSCWHEDPSLRPGFGELCETLRALLSELPELEASQEESYINHGLEVAAAAAAAAAASQETHTECGGRCENVYLPTPLGAAAAAREEDEEVADGYLKYITGSAVKGDDYD